MSLHCAPALAVPRARASRTPGGSISLLDGTVRTNAHAGRVDHRQVHLFFGARMLLGVAVAEKTRARINAERANDSRRPSAHLTAPRPWIVASKEPECCTAPRPLSLPQDLTAQAGRAPEVVVVRERKTSAPEDEPDRRALGELLPTHTKGTHVSAALQPYAPEERVKLLERGVTPCFHVQPVARIGRGFNAELDERRLCSTSIVGGGRAAHEVPGHPDLGSLPLA